VEEKEWRGERESYKYIDTFLFSFLHTSGEKREKRREKRRR
jgi:hypothetical protein